MPTIKKTVIHLLLFVVSNQPTWSLIRLFGIYRLKKVSEHRDYVVKLAKRKEITERIRRKLEDKGLRVMTGPFIGMKYPSFTSCGSTIIPKLLGTYEREIHDCFERIISKEPPIVIDVGCAEGYYAVGLAIRCSNSSIYAYDTDPVARRLCAEMAELNQVADRLIIAGKCSPETLITHDFSRGGLVIADCEGYEKYLFTHANAKSLSKADVIIELHEFLDRDIIKHIADVFSQTHDLSLVQSISDLDKAETYEFDLLSENDFDERMLAFAEGRVEIMNWAILSPK